MMVLTTESPEAVVCRPEAAAREERLEMIQEFLSNQTAQILLTDKERIRLDEPLIDMGLDSLIAVELSNVIKNELDVDILPVKLIQGPSIQDLAELIVEKLTAADEQDPQMETVVEEPVAVPIESSESEESEHLNDLLNLDNLSEDEVSALLNELMEKQ